MPDPTVAGGPTTGVRRGWTQPGAARLVTSLMFALHALVFASWTAHIPLVKQRLELDAGGLGLALLGAALGSVASMLLAGAAIARWGSRVVVGSTCVAFGLTALGVPLAGSGPTLFGALFCWGAAYGALDVAMNAQAITIERSYGRPILSSFHAWWSLGALAGSGLGIAAVHAGVRLSAQFAALGTATAAVAFALVAFMIPGDGSAESVRIVVPFGDRRLLSLGMIVLTGLLCEGAAADWTAVYLTDEVRVTPAVAGSGYAAFALAMFAGRIAGDRLVAAFG
ncbi:MAG: MFS transporter, partial [Dactylosporangium sp.]|nr:hypothetical protein [Dactylosporangium sp.]NNJ63394.1 MFS transporter [Dactylosporangium sp.]